MIAGIHQPYFIPYIGYWQLINSVDLFAIADNYNYINHGWINRNRVMEGETIRYYNIEIDHASQNRYICDHQLKPINKELKLRTLENFYHHSKYVNEGIDLMDRIFSFEGTNLADFLYNSIQLVCDYLQIKTKIVRTSDYQQDPELRFTGRIFDYCRQMGADTYYNLIGGTSLYSFEDFREHGINLAFLEPIPKPYPQRGEFVFGLSIIDVIMRNSVDEIQELLKSYRLLTETQET